MNHILTVLKLPAERGSGFIALGEMAGALDGELVNYLPTIMSHIRDAVSSLICSCHIFIWIDFGFPSVSSSMKFEILLISSIYHVGNNKADCAFHFS